MGFDPICRFIIPGSCVIFSVILGDMWKTLHDCNDVCKTCRQCNAQS